MPASMKRNLYCRADFMEHPAAWANGDTRLVVAIEVVNANGGSPNRTLRLEADVSGGELRGWKFCENGKDT